MKLKQTLKLSAGLLLVTGIGVFLYQRGEFKALSNCSLNELLIILLLTYLSYLASGIQFYYLLRKQNKLYLEIPDVCLLPLSMNLFSYIIPTNGGMLYAVYFLRRKYSVVTADGFSIGIVSVYISLLVSGVIGLGIASLGDEINLPLAIVSLLLLCVPATVHFANRILQKVSFHLQFIENAKNYIDRLVQSSRNLFLKPDIIIVNILITLFQIGITFFAYWWILMIIGVDIDNPTLMLIVLLLRISGLFRILPGNMGIEELAAGVIFSMGGESSVGLLVALLLRAANLILVIPLGIIHSLTVCKRHI